MGIVQALLPAIFALAGVAITLWFQQRARTLDLRERREELLQRKAEEVFAEIDRLRIEAAAAVARMHRFAHSEGQVEEQGIVVNPGRLIGLLRMYFPTSAEITDRYIVRNEAAMAALRQFAAAIVDNPNPEAVKTGSVVMAMELNAALGQLLGDTTGFMLSEAPKLLTPRPTRSFRNRSTG